MHHDPHAMTGNKLLDAVPLNDMAALSADFDWIEFSLGQVISEPDQPMDYAYFCASGLCSIISMVQVEDKIEMGMIGKEGFIGASILLMAKQDPFLIIAQAPGRALRLPAARLLDASGNLLMFRAVLLRFIHVFMVQTASTILANSSYLIEERLARWILMSQDRIDAVSFPMTHEFMSLMLGVRRAGVTEAVHRL